VLSSTRGQTANPEQQLGSRTIGFGRTSLVTWLNEYSTGDFIGSAVFNGIKQYNADDTYSIVGYEWFDGRMGNRHGTFVLQHDYLYFGVGIQSLTTTVRAGPGKGDFVDLRGVGKMAWLGVDGHGHLDYPLRQET
jgi:Protein of unknown function (DUF3224)